MSQQPDKLFRDKLYQYERPVSPDAWKRIAGEVRGKTPASAPVRSGELAPA